jgi:hypothetical protein
MHTGTKPEITLGNKNVLMCKKFLFSLTACNSSTSSDRYKNTISIIYICVLYVRTIGTVNLIPGTQGPVRWVK